MQGKGKPASHTSEAINPCDLCQPLPDDKSKYETVPNLLNHAWQKV